MKLTRRSFLWTGLVAGATLAVGIGSPPVRTRIQRLLGNAGIANPMGPQGWIEIGADSGVRLYCNATEMGQGVWTTLAQVVAEELEADWRQIRVEMAPVDPSFYAPWGGYGTGGSRSIRSGFDVMRQVGATARHMLLSAAAQNWQVPIKECVARQGSIHHEPSGRSAGFGELAAAAAGQDIPQAPELKPRNQWRLIGTSPRRIDAPGKVNGTASFGADLRLPNMRYAVVVHCPTPGGRLLDLDTAQVPGVEKVVRLDSAFAVVAKDTWTAMKAAGALQPKWDRGPQADASTQTFFAELHQRVQREDVQALAEDDEARGALTNADAAMRDAALKVDRTYQAPFLAHAQQETMNATVRMTEGGGIEMWVPTQRQSQMSEELASQLGIEQNKVVLHTPLLGGGFGRRLKIDYGLEAAQIARQLDHPVQVLWTREEDFRNGYFRPGVVARCRGALNPDGKLQAIDIHVAASTDRPPLNGLDDHPYAIPGRAIRFSPVPFAARLGSWRSVDMSQNTFFLESLIDECAHETRRDPLEMRRELLAGNERGLRVLDAVAELSRWTSRHDEQRHLGLAMADGFGTLTAQVVEVAVREGSLVPVRCFVAVDCGIAVNPDNVHAQLEGGVLMALSAALFEEITIRDAEVQETNFHQYRLMRIGEAIPVEVRIVESTAAVGGIGEVGVPPAAPALGNAIFAATGVRLRTLPFVKDPRVRWAGAT